MTGDYPAHGTCNRCRMGIREEWVRKKTVIRCGDKEAGWKYGAVVGILPEGHEDYPVYTPAWCPRQSVRTGAFHSVSAVNAETPYPFPRSSLSSETASLGFVGETGDSA